MEQSRPDLTNKPQQNIYLHMHHVCACQNLYASTYYPPINYPTPSVISYTTTAAAAAPPPATSPPPPPPPPPPPSQQQPQQQQQQQQQQQNGGSGSVTRPQTTARPYLQHYQYTQFNVGNQYNLPMPQLSNGSNGGNNGEALVLPQTRGGGGNRADSTDDMVGNRVQEQPPPPPPLLDFDFASIIPPINEFFLMNNSNEMEMNTDNFIRFLERSCLIAEQIAYKNRIRPCFRNIQNLCIRTRTEILKPRTTIANIHSHGIPWATKDFIYAFIRLINCWHILKGYWENSNLINLNKIEKQLTTTFKTCYIRWERETCQLATELTRIFFNLGYNQNNNNNSEQIKTTDTKTTTTTPTTNETIIVNDKNSSHGILSTETVDQANQTNLFDFDNEIIDDDNGKIYMKPGLYFVAKNCKNPEITTETPTTLLTTATATTTTTSTATTTNPCVIEFLETAQNINKGIEAMNNKYWIKLDSTRNKKVPETVAMVTAVTATATTSTATLTTTAAAAVTAPTTTTTTRDDETINNNTDNNAEVDWWSSE